MLSFYRENPALVALAVVPPPELCYAKNMAILATFNGHDKPGLTSQLTGVLAAQNAVILDVTQAVIHDLLTLSILFDAPVGSARGTDREIIADLLRKSHELGLKLETRPLELAAREKRHSHHYAVRAD